MDTNRARNESKEVRESEFGFGAVAMEVRGELRGELVEVGFHCTRR